MIKCHRSYLVHATVVKGIEGNSQAAKLTFKQPELGIPLSKTYYKMVKNELLIDAETNQYMTNVSSGQKT